MSGRGKRPVRFPEFVGVRLPKDIRDELETITTFDRKSISAWIRDLVIKTVMTYQRNPQYKRFKKRLELMAK